jgi:hypothetical protein
MRRIKPLFISLWGGRPLLKSYSTVDPTTQRSIIDPSVVLKISNAPSLSNINVSHTDKLQRKGATKPSDYASADTSSYLIHKGRAVDMIKRCVAIEGLSLSKGWTTQATQAFMIAIGKSHAMHASSL